jgi:hypothetical protein
VEISRTSFKSNLSATHPGENFRSFFLRRGKRNLSLNKKIGIKVDIKPTRRKESKESSFMKKISANSVEKAYVITNLKNKEVSSPRALPVTSVPHPVLPSPVPRAHMPPSIQKKPKSFKFIFTFLRFYVTCMIKIHFRGSPEFLQKQKLPRYTGNLFPPSVLSPLSY